MWHKAILPQPMSNNRAKRTALAMLEQFLVHNNMRRTQERLLILDAVIGREPHHFSVFDLADSLKEAGHHVSLPTVYSTLALFVKVGILRRLSINGHRPLFEQAPALGGNSRTQRSHHHMVCTGCGNIFETREPELTLESVASGITLPRAFKATDVSLVFYGLCRRCATRNQRRTASSHKEQQ